MLQRYSAKCAGTALQRQVRRPQRYSAKSANHSATAPQRYSATAPDTVTADENHVHMYMYVHVHMTYM